MNVDSHSPHIRNRAGTFPRRARGVEPVEGASRPEKRDRPKSRDRPERREWPLPGNPARRASAGWLTFVALLFGLRLSAATDAGPGRANGTDSAALPRYEPRDRVSGVIRNFGNGFGGLLAEWERGFQRFHPDVRFDDKLPTSDAAIPALVTGVTDLAPDGGEPSLTETLAFYETFGYHVTDIAVASGAFDVDGKACGPVIYVHPDNPLTRLTLEQLDGIFGAERTAGMHGFKWELADGRGPEKNIRTWGQLGLGGEWANREIHTYGHAPSGTARFFQLKVLHGGDKWNPNYREYVETGSKMIGDDDRAAQRGGLQHMLGDELLHDRDGIAWTVVPQAKAIPALKPLALAARAGDPFVVPSRESYQARTYPLVRSIYIYLHRKPGTAIEPRLREFLRFVLSRDGQDVVERNGNFLPLPAKFAVEQRAKLD